MNFNIYSEHSLRELVLESIRSDMDFYALERISIELCPDDYSTNKYFERNLNMYLDEFNSNSHEARLKYTGKGQFTVSGMTPNLARAYALWDTYIMICHDHKVDTSSWSFNPQQKKLL